MSDIREKIEKCLNLANSPEPEEARSALLKARVLMAKYKMSEEDFKDEKMRVIRYEISDISYTTMTDVWVVSLAKIIATHHCCACYNSKKLGGRKYLIGFAGFEDDFKICLQAFHYAYDFIKMESKKIVTNTSYSTAKEVRLAKNSYGIGFCKGLKEAYSEQDDKNAEYGLILATPPEVTDVLKGMGSKRIVMKNNYIDMSSRGYKDGKDFISTKKLAVY